MSFSPPDNALMRPDDAGGDDLPPSPPIVHAETPSERLARRQEARKKRLAGLPDCVQFDGLTRAEHRAKKKALGTMRFRYAPDCYWHGHTGGPGPYPTGNELEKMGRHVVHGVTVGKLIPMTEAEYQAAIAPPKEEPAKKPEIEQQPETKPEAEPEQKSATERLRESLERAKKLKKSKKTKEPFVEAGREDEPATEIFGDSDLSKEASNEDE